MLARGAEQLATTAEEIRTTHSVEVRTLAADLADPATTRIVADTSADLEIGLFVYNAAIAPAGRFLDVDLAPQLMGIEVNCATPVALCHLLAAPMVARGHGGIALISSNAANAGAVNFATYHAAKSFQMIFAESLWAELGDEGVDVTCMLVGATDSANYRAFMATLDTDLCGHPDTDDALDRARARLLKPTPPAQVATRLYDQMGLTPVCFADEDDEFVSRTCMAMPRTEAIRVWRGVQETSMRIPEKQAL
jgi:short-subunit dehydrogenase